MALDGGSPKGILLSMIFPGLKKKVTVVFSSLIKKLVVRTHSLLTNENKQAPSQLEEMHLAQKVRVVLPSHLYRLHMNPIIFNIVFTFYG